MKTIAALALVGAISSYDLNRLNQHKLYAEMALQDDTLIQTEKILENTAGSNVHGGWESNMHEFPGTQNEYGDYIQPYERTLPERFQGDAAEEGVVPVDKFTQNLIENYALEGKDDSRDPEGKKNPKPNGKFYITKAKAHTVAEEILCTHFKKCGAEATTWLDDPALHRWEHAWEYFDVLKAGKVDAVGSPTLFRYLTQDLGWLDL
jgi:hypothetical protein